MVNLALFGVRFFQTSYVEASLRAQKYSYKGQVGVHSKGLLKVFQTVPRETCQSEPQRSNNAYNRNFPCSVLFLASNMRRLSRQYMYRTKFAKILKSLVTNDSPGCKHCNHTKIFELLAKFVIVISKTSKFYIGVTKIKVI